jgi:hypothetical protein
VRRYPDGQHGEPRSGGIEAGLCLSPLRFADQEWRELETINSRLGSEAPASKIPGAKKAPLEGAQPGVTAACACSAWTVAMYVCC